MSYRENRKMSLRGIDFSTITSKKELTDLFSDYLNNNLHGLCFSPYMDNQTPTDKLSEEQITRRIKIIKPYTKWIRVFSCTGGNELIPAIAKKHGLKVLAGAWLSDDKDKNREELENLIKLAEQGVVDIAAVGNEVLYRGELSEEELLDYIYEFKEALPDLSVPVGYVDAYYEFCERPDLTDACDVILANCYPFWEGCPIEYSLLYIKDMYFKVMLAAKGKEVIITETGWPSEGEPCQGAVPSLQNSAKYFINTQKWAQEDNINMFYFSSFDESWKVGAEGDVGAFWGIWDKNEKLKF